MQTKSITVYGVAVIIYLTDKGEGLKWHDHKNTRVIHGHQVITGRTLLEIEGKEPEIRTPDHENIELACDIKHQITALEDGTIFCNVSKLEGGVSNGG